MDEKRVSRRSIFAVWHWPRWVWVVIVPLMLVGYFLGFGFVLFLDELPSMQRVNFIIRGVVGFVFYPAYRVCQGNEFLEAILEWEIDMLWGFYTWPSQRVQVPRPPARGGGHQ